MSADALALRLDRPTAVLTKLFQRSYNTAMNNRHSEPSTAARDPIAGTGWTLFNFLDVADQLYERVGRALGEVGLSYPKYEVLSHLREAGRPVSLGVLAQDQQCARSNITQIVDRLESEGLVRRLTDPDDRRSVLAELTEAGDALAREGAAQLDRLRQEFAGALGTDNCAQLNQLLSKIR